MSGLDIDVVALSAYLERHVDGFSGPLSVRKFPGGQSNPTFLLEARSGSYVLRCQPPGKLLKSAHAVDREFRVQRALAGSDVPVAPVYHLCETPEPLGVKFYLMAFEQGEIFWDPALPEVAQQRRRDYYEEAIRILAALHDVDVAAVGLADFGRPGNYFERQIAVWSSQYRASETHHIARMETLANWVQSNCPADDGRSSLVHGDYRFDNIMFRHGEPRGLAVLDWELSTLGHPLADLAYFCMCLRIPSSEYTFGLGGRDRHALGLPDERELVVRYCKRRGIDGIADWHFYIAFSFFRLAAILQGVYKRSLDGNASNERAGMMGAMVDQLAAMAIDAIEGEGSIDGTDAVERKDR
jgi:aminoglycoside phosphotransferase (APT) family kinase protein